MTQITTSNIVLSCQSVCKDYVQIDSKEPMPLPILKNISLDIKLGDSIAITGSSGSGKSTLLQLLGGLDNPTSGKIIWNQKDILSLKESHKCELRNEWLGFVYQFHHLLPEFSALENVAMPLIIRRQSYALAIHEAEKMLIKVGLKHRLSHFPSELSGGERQRVAIARALVTKPKCVLADEPTGNLDRKTASSIFELLSELNQNLDTAIIVVTHDLQLASKLKTRYELKDTQLSLIEKNN